MPKQTKPHKHHFELPRGLRKSINSVLAQPQKRARNDKDQLLKSTPLARRSRSPEQQPTHVKTYIEERAVQRNGRLGYQDDSSPNYCEFSNLVEGTHQAALASGSTFTDTKSGGINISGVTSKMSLLTRAPQHVFQPYRGDSVPILFSDKIAHSSDPQLSTHPSWEMYAYALELLQRGFTARNFGLPCAKVSTGCNTQTRRIGPALVIDDVDLHLRDKTIYVATDRGLVTVPNYLELLQVPDDQKVRFNGRVPAWAKAVFANAERRKVLYPFLPNGPGQIVAQAGGIIEVYTVQFGGWALGKMCNGDRVVWFRYVCTTPLEPSPGAGEVPFAAYYAGLDPATTPGISGPRERF